MDRIEFIGDLIDDLVIYRGKDYFVKNGITIHHPCIDEIIEYGEQKYWNMIHVLTSVGADMKFQLWDVGIDYTTISDFILFSKFLRMYFTKEQTEIIFGSLDLQKFKLVKKTDSDDWVLYDEEIDMIIDEFTYMVIVEVLRKIHMKTRNNEIPANESTKMILIEDARDEYNANKNKKYHSQLKNMVSAMTNSEGFKYSHSEVWDMKIYVFLDSVKRISKIKNADLLLQSGYSGFGVDLKKISNKQLDWLGGLE